MRMPQGRDTSHEPTLSGLSSPAHHRRCAVPRICGYPARVQRWMSFGSPFAPSRDDANRRVGLGRNTQGAVPSSP
jgi:hypothetical protein